MLAERTKRTVTEIMEPHKDVLQDMIPPKKHLLRHQPANAQIGLMEGNTFCTTLEPRLFTIDLSTVEHKVFFTEVRCFYVFLQTFTIKSVYSRTYFGNHVFLFQLLNLCEADDTALLKLPCYKSVNNLVPLKKSGLSTYHVVRSLSQCSVVYSCVWIVLFLLSSEALAACHYITQCRDKIFVVLYKSLNSNNKELQLAAHQCMEKFVSGYSLKIETVHSAVRPLLQILGDYRNLNLSVIRKLSSVTRLFPDTFNENLCDQLLVGTPFFAFRFTVFVLYFSIFCVFMFVATLSEVVRPGDHCAEGFASRNWSGSIKRMFNTCLHNKTFSKSSPTIFLILGNGGLCCVGEHVPHDSSRTFQTHQTTNRTHSQRRKGVTG